MGSECRVMSRLAAFSNAAAQCLTPRNLPGSALHEAAPSQASRICLQGSAFCVLRCYGAHHRRPCKEEQTERTNTSSALAHALRSSPMSAVYLPCELRLLRDRIRLRARKRRRTRYYRKTTLFDRLLASTSKWNIRRAPVTDVCIPEQSNAAAGKKQAFS